MTFRFHDFIVCEVIQRHISVQLFLEIKEFSPWRSALNSVGGVELRVYAYSASHVFSDTGALRVSSVAT